MQISQMHFQVYTHTYLYRQICSNMLNVHSSKVLRGQWESGGPCSASTAATATMRRQRSAIEIESRLRRLLRRRRTLLFTEDDLLTAAAQAAVENYPAVPLAAYERWAAGWAQERARELRREKRARRLRRAGGLKRRDESAGDSDEESGSSSSGGGEGNGSDDEGTGDGGSGSAQREDIATPPPLPAAAVTTEAVAVITAEDEAAAEQRAAARFVSLLLDEHLAAEGDLDSGGAGVRPPPAPSSVTLTPEQFRVAAVLLGRWRDDPSGLISGRRQ